MQGKTEMFLKKPVWQLEQCGWFSVQEETRGSLELLPWEGAALTWIHSCGHKVQHWEKETELMVSADLSQGELPYPQGVHSGQKQFKGPG